MICHRLARAAVLLVAAAAISGTGRPVRAYTLTTWTPQGIIDTWDRMANPMDGADADAWVVDSGDLLYASNTGQAIRPGMDLSGDFRFGARVRSSGTDDDRYGLMFGVLDADNNYRLSWEGNFSNGGYAEMDGSRGLSLIRELAGTSVSLINLPSAYFEPRTWYDAEVWRTGGDVGIKVARVSDGWVVVDQSVADTTFLHGYFGLWNASQDTRYNNVQLLQPDGSGSVPEPGPLAAAAAVSAAGALAWRRRRG